MKKLRTMPFLAALLIGAVSFAGCSDDDNMVGVGSSGVSFVRVGHLSPDAPAVDVWVDGSVVLQDVPFRAFSSYLQLDAGEHRIQVTPAGASDPIVIDAVVALGAGVSYTVVATGKLAQIQPTVIVDDKMTDEGSAKVRFVHASADAPNVDITLSDGSVLFGDVAFAEASPYLAVGPGEYDLQVRLAGTDTVVLSFADVALSNSFNYSVFAVGLVADGSLAAIVAVDTPGDGSAVFGLDPFSGK
jgi:hypothetical protein